MDLFNLPKGPDPNAIPRDWTDEIVGENLSDLSSLVFVPMAYSGSFYLTPPFTPPHIHSHAYYFNFLYHLNHISHLNTHTCTCILHTRKLHIHE